MNSDKVKKVSGSEPIFYETSEDRTDRSEEKHFLNNYEMQKYMGLRVKLPCNKIRIDEKGNIVGIED